MGCGDAETVEIDHVDIALVAGRDHAAIGEAGGARRVDGDVDLALDAADALELADAGNGQDGAGDGVVDEPGHRFLVQAR